MVIAAAAAAVTIAGSWHGSPTLTTHLRDDAYLEFAWVCNFVRGNGGTVSDGVTTSGVHPLWCLVLAWLSSGQPAAIAGIAVVLGIVCHAAAALSFAIAGRGTATGWLAAVVVLGNPLLLRECQNGQETAIAVLAAALLWHGRRAGWRTFTWLAMVATFARIELWLLVVALAVARRGDRLRQRLLPLLGSLGLWCLWNVGFSGSPVSDAAWPMPWLVHANFAATAPSLLDTAAQAWWYLRPALLGTAFVTVGPWTSAMFVAVVVRRQLPRSLRYWPLLATGFAAVVGASDLEVPLAASTLLVVWPQRNGMRGSPAPRTPWLVGAAMLGIVVLHWGVRWYPRDYYLAPLALAGGIAATRLRRTPWLALLLALATAAQRPLPLDDLQHQRAMAIAGVVAPAIVGHGVRVGVFNAGIVAFAQQRVTMPSIDVVNLDGIVDRRAFAALRHGRLSAWLDDEHVRYLLDNPVQFVLDPTLPHASGRWFGAGFAPERDLVELVRCVSGAAATLRPGTDDFRLYWRRGRGAPPKLPAAAVQLRDLDDGSAVVVWPATAGAVLEQEDPDGARRELCTADAAVCYAVAVDRVHGEKLFVRGAPDPLLVLRAAGE